MRDLLKSNGFFDVCFWVWFLSFGASFYFDRKFRKDVTLRNLIIKTADGLMNALCLMGMAINNGSMFSLIIGSILVILIVKSHEKERNILKLISELNKLDELLHG